MTGPGIAHHSLWPRTVYRTCLGSSDVAENGYRGNYRAPPEGGGKFDSVAIYHFTAKVIRRSHGRSAVAAAAYRSASAFTDQRQGQSFDYSDKSDVIHSEILLPDGAPASNCGTRPRQPRNGTMPKWPAKSSSRCPRSSRTSKPSGSRRNSSSAS